jgi:hypothetical protein
MAERSWSERSIHFIGRELHGGFSPVSLPFRPFCHNFCCPLRVAGGLLTIKAQSWLYMTVARLINLSLDL